MDAVGQSPADGLAARGGLGQQVQEYVVDGQVTGEGAGGPILNERQSLNVGCGQVQRGENDGDRPCAEDTGGRRHLLAHPARVLPAAAGRAGECPGTDGAICSFGAGGRVSRYTWPITWRGSQEPRISSPSVALDGPAIGGAMRGEGIPEVSRAFFDPRRAGATARHAEVYGRYQVIYTAVEFLAAVAFVVGSVFFFSESMTLAADWLFLGGSILFAVRPTVSVLREAHLARIPLPGDDRTANHASAVPGRSG